MTTTVCVTCEQIPTWSFLAPASLYVSLPFYPSSSPWSLCVFTWLVLKNIPWRPRIGKPQSSRSAIPDRINLFVVCSIKPKTPTKEGLLVWMWEVETHYLMVPNAAHGQNKVWPLHVGEVMDRMYSIRPIKEVRTPWIWSSSTTSKLEAQSVIHLNRRKMSCSPGDCQSWRPEGREYPPNS